MIAHDFRLIFSTKRTGTEPAEDVNSLVSMLAPQINFGIDGGI